jgi:hypothetical protein
MEIAFKRATHQSIGFWNDIVSDVNGVNSIASRWRREPSCWPLFSPLR